MDLSLFRKHLARVQNLQEAPLKLPNDHVAELKKRIQTLAKHIPGHVEVIRASGKFKDLGRRVRSDILTATKMHTDYDLYADGVNDDHIDSAIKMIFKQLNIKDS